MGNINHLFECQTVLIANGWEHVQCCLKSILNFHIKVKKEVHCWFIYLCIYFFTYLASQTLPSNKWLQTPVNWDQQTQSFCLLLRPLLLLSPIANAANTTAPAAAATRVNRTYKPNKNIAFLSRCPLRICERRRLPMLCSSWRRGQRFDTWIVKSHLRLAPCSEPPPV